MRRRTAPHANAPGDLLGRLDEVTRDRIRGWARDASGAQNPVVLRVLDNGVTVGEVVADRYRRDLEQAGFDHGRHSFDLTIPGGLSPLVRHEIQVQRAADGRSLANSPWVVEAAAGLLPLLASATPCRGHLDEVTRERVRGWAAEDGSSPVALLILDNGVPIARVLANRYRPDLDRAGIGHGHCAFEVAIPGGLSPLARHVLEFRRERDGAEIVAPVVIEAASSFDPALERVVANAVAALATAGEQERVLGFLLSQTERLVQLRADAERRRAPDRRLRALVIDARVPDAARDAGSQAILSHMRSLQDLGFQVSFAAAGEMAQAGLSLAAAGITSCAAPFHTSIEDVLRRQADCFDVVYLHRADIAAQYLSLARQYLPRARILYSVADLHHIRLERQAAVEERPALLAESRRMRLAECTASWSADAVITHSVHEAAILRRAVPTANVHEVPWEIPLRKAPAGFAARHGVAFVGSYSHAPNPDAARWLVEAVMPLVWDIDPAITCLLVGSDMPAAIRQLARPRVVAVGAVADLATEVLGRVRLTVAPVRFGAGVKGKVLNSFAAGVPCVMSPIAAEGLRLAAGLQALVAGGPAAMAAMICRLHADEAANREAGEAGTALIRRGFTADAVTAALGAALGRPALRATG